MLSERGNVTVDARTNTLLVQDTTAKLEDIRRHRRAPGHPGAPGHDRVAHRHRQQRFRARSGRAFRCFRLASGNAERTEPRSLIGGSQAGGLNSAQLQRPAFGHNVATGHALQRRSSRPPVSPADTVPRLDGQSARRRPRPAPSIS